MTILPLAPLERILRENGAKRVSKSATKEFAVVLEEIGSKIAVDAAELAKHSGRRTVVDADVRLASKRVRI